ncbi:hypothetical protein [Streptomyces sp. TP-A0356]|uniref:hypothetical protein n=1 Tax=Streptomyces sp. TP-A0356 TaxID=1359208 RepID=UPI0006E45814|nr:hypothetical protein [Streptomyces sp. TP-A0356]
MSDAQGTPRPPNRGSLRLVLVADPGLPSEIARSLAPRLPGQLRRATGAAVRWEVDAVTVPLVADDQVDVSRIADMVSGHLEGMGWDIGIFITDLPRRARLYPVSVEVDTERRVALISLPALGSRRLRRRVRQAVVDIVRQMVSRERALEHPKVIGRPPREPAPGLGPQPRALRRYVVPGLRGHVRLISGMVRANRPWRLFGSLSRALAGVFATATILFINTATWNLATALSAWKQALITVVSALALSAWIIIDHRLWEHADELPARHHPLYPYNLVTLITVALAVAFLAAMLFVTLVAVSFLLLEPSVLRKFVGRPVVAGDYLFLCWFITSIAMIGGAFGTGLEGDEEVRDATYGRRQRERQRQLKERSARSEDGEED